MKITSKMLLIAACFALALSLMFTGTASARFVSDGAVPDGAGGWKAPTDGVCIVSLAPDGTMVTNGTTNYRDCMASLVDVTAVTADDTLANVCGKTSKNTDGVKYAAPGSSTCVTIDGSGYITGSITLKDMDKNAVMCGELGGQLANATATTLTSGYVISTATKTIANGTAAKCGAYGWLYRGQDANGAPLAFGAEGTTAAQGAGFCYTNAMKTGIDAASCPSTSTNYLTAFGYAVGGGNCLYAYGITGDRTAALTKVDGTSNGPTGLDLASYTTMGDCLANGGSWNNWVPKDGTTVLTSATIATFDHSKQASGSDREGCLHCHGLDQSRSPVERFKESFLKTGHKNMLRKVTANQAWAGPNADGVMEEYTDYAAGTIDWANATATVGGIPKPLLYIFGDWMAPAPGGLDVVVDMGANGAKYNGTSNYSCAACHSTGFSKTFDVNAGLCSVSSKTNSTDCGTAGGTWAPMTGAQGAVGQEPVASFPGINFNGIGDWDLDGITCTRCHGSVSPAPPASAFYEVQVGGHQNSVWDDYKAITNLCYGCHQSPAKTANGTGADIDTANPQNIPVKDANAGARYQPEFSGHVLGNSFLNSPHGKFTGTITPNAVGKWNIAAGGTNTSTFVGKACYQGATNTSPALSKGDGTFIHDKADCETLYGAGAWKTELADEGTCTTCHDVHNSLFVEGQEHHPLRRECETCHEDTADNGYADAGVPQKNIALSWHPTNANSPFDTSQHVNACEVCHMPKATSGGFPMHLWRINTDGAYSTFPSAVDFATNKIGQSSPDGSYTPAVWVDVNYACGQCHGGGVDEANPTYLITEGYRNESIPYYTKAELAVYAETVHGDKPIANFTAAIGTPNNMTVSVDASSSSCASTCSYSWNWGDATANGSGVTASHTYASARQYTITLTVTDNTYSSTATKARLVSVFSVDAAPHADGCATGQIGWDANTWTATCNDVSSDDIGLSKVTVNFGAGPVKSDTTAPFGPFTYTYTTVGTKTITHKAYDTIGQTNTETTTVTPAYFVISGTVYQSNGTTPVSGAKVVVKKGTKTMKTIYTSGTGTFSATNLKPGTYTLTVTRTGHTFTVPAATVIVGPSSTGNIINATP